ncbi:19S/PA700 proteasome regulatory particle subunit Rpn2p/S2 [Enterocytozoon bieneusi H348]|nr:19S/PA700 proteasome regulatory particle subunit Rpn2p/S2 [Enterocytozoon bieneusi H348]|eukprot:XP_002652474.1 19S/PA700 proteasome regulatory particle subunit Rpn2p/S2 [Enterocytozoon bieneusi H348]
MADTGIQSGYRELFVFMQETKRSRRFKKTNGERFNDVVKEFVGEVKNNTRINYRDILMKGRYNLIDFM